MDNVNRTLLVEVMVMVKVRVRVMMTMTMMIQTWIPLMITEIILAVTHSTSLMLMTVQALMKTMLLQKDAQERRDKDECGHDTTTGSFSNWVGCVHNFDKF